MAVDPPSDPYDPFHDQPSVTAHHFPRKPHPRQGFRKSDKWGFCRHCNVGTALKCSRCEHWTCQDCARLRKKKGLVGVYFLHCYPRCVLRRTFEIKEPADLAKVASEYARAALNGAPKPHL